MIIINVLFIHNYYQQSGGEDKVVSQEMNLLKSKGIDVKLYSVHNDVINSQGVLGKARIASESIWSYTMYKKAKQFLMDLKPDVVHIHNFFPLISPSVYYACSSLNIPVVQTLHNYRLICPSATFLRSNRICEACLKGSILNSIKHGCYRNSRIQTIPVLSLISLNKLIRTWNGKVNRYIALTNFAKDKFVESGILADKIVVKPNFIIQRTVDKSIDDNYILFVGRMSIEKGIHLLLEAWKDVNNKKNTKLIIIGDGPEREHLENKYYSEDIKFLGKQDEATVSEYMKNAKYLAVPSIWYEGFPMTIIEAYSLGTPVLCSNIGSLKEVVVPGITGLHFEYNNSLHLARVIEQALNFDGYDMLRKNVMRNFNEKYTSEINYKQIISIYKEVIKENKDGILS